jgi:diguanylate cyclase (GGDEF)-like protein
VARVALAAAITCGSLLVVAPLSLPADAVSWPLLMPVGLAVLALLCAVVSAAAAVRAVLLTPVWTALTVIFLLFGAADVAWAVAPPHHGGASWIDAVYGTAYVVLAATPLVFLRRLRLRPHLTVWFDGLATGLGALALSAAFVLNPTSSPGDDTVALALGYVAADTVIVAVLASLASVLGSFRSVALALAAVGGQLVADGGQYFAITSGRAVALTDLFYVVSPLLLAAAAHRCPAEWTLTERSWRPRLEIRRMVLPLGGTTAALLVLTWSAVHPLGAVPTLLAVAALVATAARTVLTLRATETFYELRAQALTDPLTGLGNRRELDAALARLLRATRTRSTTALLLLDLDSFRDVNDALGHLAGDEVLRLQAARLTVDTPPGWVVVRLAGDTFAVVLPDTGPDEARAHAQELVDRLGRPLHTAGTRLRLSASVGIAVAPAEGGTGCATTLLRRAHEALARAKGSSEVVVVDHGDRPAETEVARLHLAEELQTALAEDQLVMWFQPQLHLRSTGTGTQVTTVAGCEALVRWAHPTRGLLGAGQVLAAAEHGRLLPALSDAVLRLTLAAAATWWEGTQVPVSVNLSATDLDDQRLPDRVDALLREFDLPPWALTVEVVEDTLVLGSGRSAGVLTRLRDLGVGIAIDDYGTGYSSLAYLHELPVDELKLDRSLTVDLSTNPAAAAIARHSIALAHELGLRVVGEGIEEPEALDALTAMGCDVVQGFLTGAPMAHADWLAWLARRPVVPARPAAVHA